MKTIIRITSRLIIGIVFIFSGFVKAIDPLGSAYKFTDYFNAFGMEAFAPIAFSLAIILSTAEFAIGISLLLGIKTRWGIWGAFLFMLVFTPLTFYLAIKDPVHDCGCFGDALILTNWQTFFKNIFIHAFVLLAFFERKRYKALFCCKAELIATGGIIILITSFSIYCYYHLPVIDFRPYKIGTHIPNQMIIPDGAPTDDYDILLYYEKNGEVKEFQLEDIPDSSWKWIRTENVLINKGYEPPIHDFSINSMDGMDITDIILEDDNYTFLYVAYDILKSNTRNQQKINQLADYCRNKRIRFICLTSSLTNDILQFGENHNIKYNFYITDEIPLKTMIRANPGLVLLKKGTILGKWHYNDFPDIKKLEKNYITEEPSGNCAFCD